MDIRNGPAKSCDLIITLTTENGGITLGGALGTIRLFISGDVSNNTAASGDAPTTDNPILIGDSIGTQYYDLFLIPTAAGEQPIQLLQGTIAIEESVSDV